MNQGRQFVKPLQNGNMISNDGKKQKAHYNRVPSYQVKTSPSTEINKQQQQPPPPQQPTPLSQDLVAFKSVCDTSHGILASLRVSNNQMITYGRMHLTALSESNDIGRSERNSLSQIDLLLREYLEELNSYNIQITQRIYELQTQISGLYTARQQQQQQQQHTMSATAMPYFYTAPFIQQQQQQQQQIEKKS